MSVCPTLMRKVKQHQGFDAELFQQVGPWVEYIKFIRSSFNQRKGHGNMDERWNELKEAIVGSAEK